MNLLTFQFWLLLGRLRLVLGIFPRVGIGLFFNKRLTSISSSQKVFDEAIPPYQKALDESSYKHKLTYNPQPKRKRNRQRKIIWYNPLWNANVKTNLGRKFLNIIDRCFPNGHPLHKIFNKHTLKLSYSCIYVFFIQKGSVSSSLSLLSSFKTYLICVAKRCVSFGSY